MPDTMTRAMRLDIPIVLPGVKDERDACVARLIELLERRPGVESVHVLQAGEAPPSDAVHAGRFAVVPDRAALCLHYDPNQLSMQQIASIASGAGVEITRRYAHDVITINFVGAEDGAQRLERGLKDVPGLTAASVNLAAQVVRVEYDTTIATRADVDARLRELSVWPVSGPRHAQKHTPGAVKSAEASAPSVGSADAPPLPAPPPSDKRAAETPSAQADRCCDAATRIDVPRPRGTPQEDDDHAEHAGATWYGRNRELVWSLSAGVFLLAGVIAQRTTASAAIPLGLFAVAYVFGAWDNVSHFLKDLRVGRVQFDIDLLMVVAAAGAAILGQWREGALLLFLFSLGHALEHYALGRARNAITALADLAPQEASVVRDGVTSRVPIAEVRLGDHVVIKPGERVSVDGTVREGSSAVDQAPITGESVPVPKSAGEAVFAGSVNGDGALVVDVTAVAGDRTLDRVIQLVADAQTQKAPTQQFTDRFERVFVPVVLIGDALLMIVPPLLGIWSWHDAVYRAMTVLVAASPCALALGTPAAVLAGIAQAARNGVLIKGGAHLETLGGIRTLALDKTGTITRGKPAVTDVVAQDGVGEDDLVRIAAGVEARSQHPLAHAVVEEAKRRGLTVSESTDVEAVSGKAVRGHVDGALVEAGRALYFEDGSDGGQTVQPLPASLRATVDRLEQAGRTAIIVRQSGTPSSSASRWLGVLAVADAPRDNARVAIQKLRDVGIEHILMLTGDNAGVGSAIAKEVGIEDVRADLLPEDKLTIIKELEAKGPVAMIGDGVNDAPALAHATVGIAMGGAGTAAALETADVALMGDDLERVAFAIGLSRQARAVIRQNLFVSLGVIVVLVSAAVTGRVGIASAVVFHEGSTLVVIANGLRLLAYRARTP